MTKETFRQLYIDCGKCDKKHGPYWYAETWLGGKVFTRYVGKTKPEDELEDEDAQAVYRAWLESHPADTPMLVRHDKPSWWIRRTWSRTRQG